jgi:cellobiose phosphorylase
MEDCDWGGGGQYVGQPLKIVEMLFDLGEADRAWQLLWRCTQWVERFPYFPQTIFGDNLALAEHQIDWPLQISSGAGAQAIVAGIFGLKPHPDGALTIQPHYNSTLGTATLTGYHFRGHTYSITLHATRFAVGIDGKPQATSEYDKPLHLPPHHG